MKRTFVNYKKKDFKLLDKTKQIFKEKDRFSKEELKEYSILYILLNFMKSAENKLETLKEINFSNKINNDLKDEIINNSHKDIVDKKFEILIKDIEKSANLKNILNKKNHSEIEEILEELIQELKEMNHLKQIEFLEKKVAKNLDETSYSELVKLKSQLNRE